MSSVNSYTGRFEVEMYFSWMVKNPKLAGETVQNFITKAKDLGFGDNDIGVVQNGSTVTFSAGNF